MFCRQQIYHEVLHVGLGVAVRVIAGNREFHGGFDFGTCMRSYQWGKGTNIKTTDMAMAISPLATVASKRRCNASGFA